LIFLLRQLKGDEAAAMAVSVSASRVVGIGPGRYGVM
jgi:hypothetical protein